MMPHFAQVRDDIKVALGGFLPPPSVPAAAKPKAKRCQYQKNACDKRCKYQKNACDKHLDVGCFFAGSQYCKQDKKLVQNIEAAALAQKEIERWHETMWVDKDFREIVRNYMARCPSEKNSRRLAVKKVKSLVTVRDADGHTSYLLEPFRAPTQAPMPARQ